MIPTTQTRFAKGLTLVELMTAMGVTAIIVLIVGTLVCASQKQWNKTYTYANTSIEADAVNTMLSFGATGRQSNKNDYVVYKVANGVYTKAMPATGGATDIADGNAVEFRCWQGDFESSMLDTSKTGTKYVLYYLEGSELKMDIGPYDYTTHIGGVRDNRRISSSQTTTTTLSYRVASVKFSHNTKNTAGDGDGSVRMDITFQDSVNRDTLTIKVATLMRNVWPE